MLICITTMNITSMNTKDGKDRNPIAILIITRAVGIGMPS